MDKSKGLSKPSTSLSPLVMVQCCSWCFIKGDFVSARVIMVS